MTVLQFLAVVKFSQKIAITTKTTILYHGCAGGARTNFDKLLIDNIYATKFGKIIIVVNG